MPFRFRLEKVARVRSLAVDERSRAVAVAARTVRALAARLAALEADIARQRGDVTDPGAPGPSVQALLARSLWLEHLEEIRRSCVRELGAAEADLTDARARLRAAWRDREVLDRLRVRRERQWREDQRRREMRDADEVAQVRAAVGTRSKVAT